MGEKKEAKFFFVQKGKLKFYVDIDNQKAM